MSTLIFFFSMIRRPPRSTRTDTLFPYTTLCRSPAAPGPTIPDYVTAALADTSRGDDVYEDSRREIAAIMAFSEVKPGDTVLELVPGSGYWTRAFSGIVGPSGKVYLAVQAPMEKYSAATKTLPGQLDRKSVGEGTSVSLRGDFGGGRISKKKKK